MIIELPVPHTVSDSRKKMHNVCTLDFFEVNPITHEPDESFVIKNTMDYKCIFNNEPYEPNVIEQTYYIINQHYYVMVNDLENIPEFVKKQMVCYPFRTWSENWNAKNIDDIKKIISSDIQFVKNNIQNILNDVYEWKGKYFIPVCGPSIILQKKENKKSYYNTQTQRQHIKMPTGVAFYNYDNWVVKSQYNYKNYNMIPAYAMQDYIYLEKNESNISTIREISEYQLPMDIRIFSKYKQNVSKHYFITVINSIIDSGFKLNISILKKDFLSAMLQFMSLTEQNDITDFIHGTYNILAAAKMARKSQIVSNEMYQVANVLLATLGMIDVDHKKT